VCHRRSFPKSPRIDGPRTAKTFYRAKASIDSTHWGKRLNPLSAKTDISAPKVAATTVMRDENFRVVAGA
jgi:hypothetical protein